MRFCWYYAGLTCAADDAGVKVLIGTHPLFEKEIWKSKLFLEFFDSSQITHFIGRRFGGYYCVFERYPANLLNRIREDCHSMGLTYANPDNLTFQGQWTIKNHYLIRRGPARELHRFGSREACFHRSLKL